LILKVANADANAPAFNQDWDSDNDGLIDDTGDTGYFKGTANWSFATNVIDAVGASAESDDLTSGQSGFDTTHCLYGKVCFAAGEFNGDTTISTGYSAVNINTNDSSTYNGSGSNANAFGEIECVHRKTSGTANSDWVATNLTDNAASGYSSSTRNYGVSGNHGGTNLPESVQANGSAVSPYSYGADITINLYSTNP
jgi:hypothetical protein